jgi:hypothetical protein
MAGATLRAAAPQTPAAESDWPAGAPVVPPRSWESYRGAYEDDNARRVSYSLYIDPVYFALYRVTRYTVSGAAGATGEDALAVETVHFFLPPVKGPSTSFQRRVDPGAPRPWLPLEQGTPAYKAEMLRAIEVFVRHRRTMP